MTLTSHSKASEMQQEATGLFPVMREVWDRDEQMKKFSFPRTTVSLFQPMHKQSKYPLIYIFFLSTLRRLCTAAERNARIAASRDSSCFPEELRIWLETEEARRGGRGASLLADEGNNSTGAHFRDSWFIYVYSMNKWTAAVNAVITAPQVVLNWCITLTARPFAQPSDQPTARRHSIGGGGSLEASCYFALFV